eukprot:6094850-Alexandrium_andersonii.AAC.1
MDAEMSTPDSEDRSEPIPRNRLLGKLHGMGAVDFRAMLLYKVPQIVLHMLAALASQKIGSPRRPPPSLSRWPNAW